LILEAGGTYSYNWALKDEGNNRSLLLESHDTHICALWAKCSYLILKQVVYIVSTGL
jgi:hypothetical protein